MKTYALLINHVGSMSIEFIGDENQKLTVMSKLGQRLPQVGDVLHNGIILFIGLMDECKKEFKMYLHGEKDINNIKISPSEDDRVVYAANVKQENKVWNEQKLKEAIAEQWGEFGVHMDVFNTMLKLIKSMTWIKYSWENRKSHPPCAGRYLIYRKRCDKMHFEQWNGNGWASSNGDCTHWMKPNKPEKLNVKKYGK